MGIRVGGGVIFQLQQSNKILNNSRRSDIIQSFFLKARTNNERNQGNRELSFYIFFFKLKFLFSQNH